MWKRVARRYHAAMKAAAVLALLVASSFVGCKKQPDRQAGQRTNAPAPTERRPDAAAPVASAETHWYRVEILGAEEDPEMRVIFQLGLASPRTGSSVAQVANGNERLRWTMHCESETHCSVDIPIYSAALDLRFASKNDLQGTWMRDPVAYKDNVDVRGSRIPGPELAHRMESGEAPTADFSGEWFVTSEDFGRARANFEQDAQGGISGTITPKGVGDSRFLAGRVFGNVALLSTFDGQRAYAVRMELDPDTKNLAGSWVLLDFATRSFAGTRDPAPSLLDELYVDEVVSSDRRVSLPELEALRGQPVIVDLFGTWCPTCLDTVPTLVALHEEFSPRGLRVLSIAYELTDDEQLANRRLEAFHERFKVKWPTVVRLGEDFEALLPEELEPTGFPITLFVNRDGTVHRMNTGFVSPAAPEDHKAIVEAFHRWTEEIMGSEPINERTEPKP